MFWIGLIIGVMVGYIVCVCIAIFGGAKSANLSLDEFWQVCGLVYEAGHNRESTITAVHNQEIIETIVLEEN